MRHAYTFERKASKTIEKRYDILADWEINKFCNFRSQYCFIDRAKRENPEYIGHSIDRIADAFNRSGLVWLIHMSGGEPFLQPRFVELCVELTKRHYISVNTNLSTQNVYDFSKKLNPDRVAFVHCSLHIDERERLGLVKPFIEKYQLLKDCGFNAYVTQVMYPPMLNRFDQIFSVFSNNGIVVAPKNFRGYYHMKRYPRDYTQRERNTIQRFQRLDESKTMSESHIDPDLDRLFLSGDLCFKGSLCGAGKDFVVIQYDGEVRRCVGEKTKLGNIFEGEIELLDAPEPCSARICPCPYYGLRYARGYKVVRNRSLSEIPDSLIMTGKATVALFRGFVKRLR